MFLRSLFSFDKAAAVSAVISSQKQKSGISVKLCYNMKKIWISGCDSWNICHERVFVLTVCLQDAPAPSAHVMFCILPAFFFFMSSLQLRPQPRKQSVSPSWNLVPVLEALPPASLPVKDILENQFQEPVSQWVGWSVGRWCRTSRGTVSMRSKQKNPPG